MSARARQAPRASPALVALLAWAALGGASCGSGPGEAGIAPQWRSPGPGTPPGDDPVSQPSDELDPHSGVVLPAMQVEVVYIGVENADGVANRDDFVSWVVASGEYWGLLAQYGVSAGTLSGSKRVASASFFPPYVLDSGSITTNQLRDVVAGFVTPAVDGANAYLFLLPGSVGVTTVDGGQRESCSNFAGYHSYVVAGTSAVPFAVVAACPEFPADLPISHELAEMATDPTGVGWYSARTGEEVGDLCNFPVTTPLHFWSPTRLWSNADGACAPP